jgi:hypothetical protein
VDFTLTGHRGRSPHRGVAFKGTNADLNVFSITRSLLDGTTNYAFDVPPQSTVIVNVSALMPVIQNASFTDAAGNPLGVRNMLWNFFHAAGLTIQSTGFPASILAPGAVATLKWGSILGTVVVWSATVEAEIYTNPFRIPGCGGCLCLDQKWSCSNDTTLDDTGTPAVLGAEAGFLFIKGGQYTAENTTRYAPDHRIWYSFRPADVRPKDAPLAVFFNGGPGSATSAVLFSWDTGPMTFVDKYGDGKSVAMHNNAHSWTQFANLLYIDAPASGFSYPLPHNGNPTNDVGIDIDGDAGIFLRVIANFLQRHLALVNNRVLIVGESYGGTRATLMLNYLYNLDKIAVGGGGAYQDQQVHDDLIAYLSKALPSSDPSAVQIQQIFGHQALIQPEVAGADQDQYDSDYPPQNCLPPSTNPDPRNPGKCYMYWQPSGSSTFVKPTCDTFNCDKPVIDDNGDIGWSKNLEFLVAAQLTTVTGLNQMLGVDASTIAWMHASARTQAFGRDAGDIVAPSQSWLDTFGHTLVAGDNYFMVQNNKVYDGYGCMRSTSTLLCTGTPARDWYNAGGDIGGDFIVNTRRIETLITVTKHDSVVSTLSIAKGLNDGNPSFNQYLQTCPQPHGGHCGVSYSSTTAWTPPLSHPGEMSIAFNIEGYTGISTVVMPTAYESGHSVTMRDGDNFMSDVQKWYKNTAY